MMHAKTRHLLLGCLMFGSGVLATSLASGKPAQEVEHAPTVAVCRADSAVWNSDFMKNGPKDSVGRISVQELLLRESEMNKCGFVDPPHPDNSNYNHPETYLFLQGLYSNEIGIRLVDFITRHNMWQQFLDEDAAGKR